MMRSKPASSMQKTYDECYLMCSTAVYFESRNNESEALRSWKSALDTIHHHNAYRMPPNYVSRSETEKALVKSIRDLELQCKERVDLLEALRQSRQETGPSQETYTDGGPLATGGQETGNIAVNEEIPTVPQWLGDHDVSPLQYTNVNRPPPPPPPTRAAPPRPSSENNSRSSLTSPNYAADTAAIPSPQTLPIPSPQPGTPRTLSPERKPMLTTLRSRESKKPPPPPVVSPPKPARPTASKAAGLAWNSISRLTGGPSSSSSQSMVGPSNNSIYSLRKSISNDQEPRRGSTDLSSLTSEQAKSAKNQYVFDMARSQSAGEQASSQNLATGAAVAATKPPQDEPLIDLSEPSPPIPAPSPAPSPSFPLFSKRTPKEKESSNKLMPPITKHRSRPDYLEPRPTTRSYIRTSPQGQRTYSSSQPHLARNSSDDVVRAPGMHLAHSLGPISRQQSHESPGTATPPNADESRGGYFMETARSGSAGNSEIKQGKRPVRQRSNTTPTQTLPPNDNVVPEEDIPEEATEEDGSVKKVMKNLPKGVDPPIAQQILNDIVVRGDEVHWDDVAGLETAKKALKEAVVYPFLRPDLFMGLREPARGMLLFGPPGTGKTMLARAVATESRSTFFSVSASSLTSKWHGESEKLVRALFALAKAMAPSIIFVDEIDSLLSSRSTASEGEASRRSKTEFLIQWSDLQRAAAGREQSEGDATRVLVLAATNMPWDIDEAARRRFVRRQYIPLPEPEVRKMQLEKLLSHQKQDLLEEDIEKLVEFTDGFSGSDITALAKDAAMGPLRNLGEDLLHTPMEQIRPICVDDFEASLSSIRPSVSRDGLKEYETWAKEFGERGG